MDDFRLEGHVGVITGGGRGIGEGIAYAMADAGADVVVAARREGDLARVVEGIEKRGRRGLAVPTDVLDRAAIERLVASAIEAFGKITVWVNNAGGNQDRVVRDLAEMPDAAWDEMIEFNLTSAFLGIRGAIPHMPEGSSIVNIVSGAALNAAPHTGAYGAAKAGVVNMTMTLARELADRRIRVNAIAPGPIVTEQFMETFPMTDEQLERFGKSLPTGRLGDPLDIGAGVVYFASKAGSWVTGQTISINGGHVPGSMAVVARG
tara:strand:- start:129 stop:917 length:789 start_codon:yes stop_codon:yes gene_type:complete